jgi:hypothetical protein
MLSFPESWAINSAYFHGTHVPVEEPCTASKTDIVSSFDHSSARSMIGGNCQAERVRGLEIEHKLKLGRGVNGP